MKINGIQPKSEELNTNGKSYTKITITLNVHTEILLRCDKSDKYKEES